MIQVESFDFSVDLLSALIWQYNDAENLEGLITAKQAEYTRIQTDFWNNWFRDVFNLRTANEFGLSVWSIILDLPLFSELDTSPDDYMAWGFATAGSANNFDNANFAVSAGEFVNLDTEQKRLILRLRYHQLTSTGTVTDINRILNDVFGEGIAFVADNRNMTITYTFSTIPDSRLLFALDEFDVLPRPSGVRSSITITALRNWGFGEHHNNFNRGNFGGGTT